MSHPNDMRPVQFTRGDGELIRGHFHHWAEDASQYEGVSVSVAVIEDNKGCTHVVNADVLVFTDRPGAQSTHGLRAVIQKAVKLIHTHDQVTRGEWEELEDELNALL